MTMSRWRLSIWLVHVAQSQGRTCLALWFVAQVVLEIAAWPGLFSLPPPTSKYRDAQGVSVTVALVLALLEPTALTSNLQLPPNLRSRVPKLTRCKDLAGPHTCKESSFDDRFDLK